MELFLNLIKHQIVKKYGEMEVGLHTFITLALVGWHFVQAMFA